MKTELYNFLVTVKGRFSAWFSETSYVDNLNGIKER